MKRSYLPFQEARAFARSLGLGSVKDWYGWCRSERRPAHVPSNPNLAYRGAGWEGYGDWLGTGNVSNRDRRFLRFEEGRELARSLGLASMGEWQTLCAAGKCPKELPTNPDKAYAACGWGGYPDWLGNAQVSNKVVGRGFVSIETASILAREAGVKSSASYRRARREGRLDVRLVPGLPECFYKAEWMGWAEFLGVPPSGGHELAAAFLGYEEAARAVRDLGLVGQGAFRRAVKDGRLPAGVPTNPHRTYRGRGWVDYASFLGHDRHQPWGEATIARALDRAGVGFVHQAAIEGCRHVGTLRFDFGIDEKSGYTAMVEYRGEQHFRPVEWFGGEAKWQALRLRDRVKREFCAERSIPLIVVTGTDEAEMIGYLLGQLSRLGTL